MIEAQKEKYRRIITSNIDQLASGTAEDREAVYGKLRTANETILDRKRDSLSPEDADALRRALEEVIAEDRLRAAQHDEMAAEPVEAVEDSSAEPLAAEPAIQLTAEVPLRVDASSDAEAGHAETESRLAEDEATSEPAPASLPALAQSRTRLLLGAAAGAAFVLVGGFAATVAGLLSFSQPGEAAATSTPSLESLYLVNLPKVRPAVDFLEKVRTGLASRQKNGERLPDDLARKFVSLDKVDAELAAAMPADLPKGTAIVVRANQDDYKILYNWTLCATVQIAQPEMVDPKRKNEGLGCSHFGIWSQNAESW